MRLSFSESDIDQKTQLSPAADRAEPGVVKTAAISGAKDGLTDDWVDPDKTHVVPAHELAARRTTVSIPAEPTDGDTDEKEPKTFLGLNLPQVIGGVLASTTAAILGAQLGLAGTIVGAAMTTGIITVGGALYGAFIKKTHSTFAGRFRRQDGPKEPTAQLELLEQEPEESAAATWRDKISPWKLLATAAAIFLLAGAVVTGLEVLRGEALSGDGKTTVGQVGREGLSNSSSSSEQESDSGDITPDTQVSQPVASPEPTVQETEQPAPVAEPEPTTEPTEAPATTEPDTATAGGSAEDSTSEGTDTGDSTSTVPSDGASDSDSASAGSDSGGSTTERSGGSSTNGSGSNATNSLTNPTNSLTENRTLVEDAPAAE